MGNLKKKDVYVVVNAPKKAKKLKKVLDMFGEYIESSTNKDLRKYRSPWLYDISQNPIVFFLDEVWIGSWQSVHKDKTEVSIKELRDILANEHLKRGDICIFYDIQGYYTDVFKEICQGVFEGQFEGEKGIYTRFKRYATPEEIALLEGKKDVLGKVKDKVLFQDKIDYAKKSLEGAELPKLEKKELVVGRWYKSLICPKFLGIHLKKDRYGFDTSGVWFDNCNVTNLDHESFINNLTEATPQEVESALIDEAKRRYKVIFYAFEFNSDNNILYGHYDDSKVSDLFKDGKWATIIEQDKFAELKEAHKNGAVIQFKSHFKPFEWIDVHNNNPGWQKEYEYRIKPEEKPKVGDVCKFWDEDDSFIIGIYKEHDGTYHRHMAEFGAFDNAKTLTQQEAIDLLFKK